MSRNLIFSPEITQAQCHVITINDDAILENNEVFMVALSTADESLILSPRTSSVTIVDDDGNLPSYSYGIIMVYMTSLFNLVLQM